MTQARRALGASGEDQAARWYEANGYQVVARNWRCRYGELDIIAADNASRTAVFVEVKTRTGDGFGGVAEAVPPQKVRRLRRLAARWLAAHPDRRGVPVRFDVVSVRREAGLVRVGHLRGAF